MSLTSRMVKTLLLAFIFAAGVYTNGFAFDLTQRHSEKVPEVADVFSKAWLVEAQKQFDSAHSTEPLYLFICTGILAILFIAYGVSRFGRASGVRLFSSVFTRHGLSKQCYTLRLISRWGGALVVPIACFRRISPSLLSARNRISPSASSPLS